MIRLKINGADARTAYGLYLLEGSIDALLSPPAVKDPIIRQSRLQDGVRSIRRDANGNSLGRVDSRDVTLQVAIEASGHTQLHSRLAKLIAVLARDTVRLEVSELPGIVFKLDYVSCTTFSQLRGRLSKAALRFTEPNPLDRS